MTQKNIILVTVDSLRADHCGFIPGGKELTPTLSCLADEGYICEQAIAPGPKTAESLPETFTDWQLTPNIESDLAWWEEEQKRIKEHMEAHETIAERLSRRGYTTIGITPGAYTSREYGFDSGFDIFEDFLDSSLKQSLLRRTRDTNIPFARALVDWLFRDRNFKPWESFFDDVRSAANEATEPFFLWVCLMDTHMPYFAPREYRTDNSWLDMMRAVYSLQSNYGEKLSPERHQSAIRAYEDTVRYTDAFFSRLEEEILDPETALIVHSDHGEAFFEHESYYHRRYLYEENIHVPLLFWNCDVTGRYEGPVSMRLMPEFVAAIADGRELTDFMDANSRPISFSEESGRAAERGEHFKLIIGPTDIELFNL